MHDAFLSRGWSVEELDKDYGEDLLVRIFENEEATPYTFYVQAKSVESLKRYSSKNDSRIRYPIDFDHLNHWGEFWEPVFLMIWDQESDLTFWDIAQDPEFPADTSGKKAKFFIPKDNLLDDEGLQRILNKTLARHRRFQNEQDGADVLIELLSNSLDAKIDYNAQAGILFVERRGELPEITFFGKAAERFEWLGEKSGLPPQLLLEKAVSVLAEAVTILKNGDELHMVDINGRTVKSYRSIDELYRTIDRADELDQY